MFHVGTTSVQWMKANYLLCRYGTTKGHVKGRMEPWLASWLHERWATCSNLALLIVKRYNVLPTISFFSILSSIYLIVFHRWVFSRPWWKSNIFKSYSCGKQSIHTTWAIYHTQVFRFHVLLMLWCPWKAACSEDAWISDIQHFTFPVRHVEVCRYIFGLSCSLGVIIHS